MECRINIAEWYAKFFAFIGSIIYDYDEFYYYYFIFVCALDSTTATARPKWNGMRNRKRILCFTIVWPQKSEFHVCANEIKSERELFVWTRCDDDVDVCAVRVPVSCVPAGENRKLYGLTSTKWSGCCQISFDSSFISSLWQYRTQHRDREMIVTCRMIHVFHKCLMMALRLSTVNHVKFNIKVSYYYLAEDERTSVKSLKNTAKMIMHTHTQTPPIAHWWLYYGRTKPSAS